MIIFINKMNQKFIVSEAKFMSLVNQHLCVSSMIQTHTTIFRLANITAADEVKKTLGENDTRFR